MGLAFAPKHGHAGLNGNSGEPLCGGCHTEGNFRPGEGWLTWGEGWPWPGTVSKRGWWVYYNSLFVVIGTAYMDTLVAAQGTRAAAALIVAPKVRLYGASPYNPQVGDAIADLTPSEMAFSGYPTGGVAPTFTGPVRLSPSCQGLVGSVVFEATGSPVTTPGTAYGFWVDDGTNVLWQEPFAGAFTAPFAIAGDFLVLNLVLPFPQRVATS